MFDKDDLLALGQEGCPPELKASASGSLLVLYLSQHWAGLHPGMMIVFKHLNPSLRDSRQPRLVVLVLSRFGYHGLRCNIGQRDPCGLMHDNPGLVSITMSGKFSMDSGQNN